MSYWETVRLDEVIELQRGHDLPLKARVEGEIPVLGSNGVVGYHNQPKYSGPGVTIGRSGVIGGATFTEGPYWPLNTCLFVKNFMGNDPRWVYYWLKSVDFTALDSGSAQPSLNRNYIASFPVSLPSHHEQRAIAEVLGALDDKIAANTKFAVSADSFLAALFHQLTRDASFITLGEVATVNPATSKPVLGGSLRYIDISSVGQGTFVFPDVSAWDDAPSRARRHIQSGDTLWSTVRPNRRSHALVLSDDDLLVGSTGLAVLRPRDIGFAYLYEATKTTAFTAYLENVAEGSAYPAVRANRFIEAPLKWAAASERESFEAIAAPLRQTVHSLTEENLTLAATREALLPHLMSGKLRVKDAEKVLEDAL